MHAPHGVVTYNVSLTWENYAESLTKWRYFRTWDAKINNDLSWCIEGYEKEWDIEIWFFSGNIWSHDESLINKRFKSKTSFELVLPYGMIEL